MVAFSAIAFSVVLNDNNPKTYLLLFKVEYEMPKKLENEV